MWTVGFAPWFGSGVKPTLDPHHDEGCIANTNDLLIAATVSRFIIA
jgi:hypothetical protein